MKIQTNYDGGVYIKREEESCKIAAVGKNEVYFLEEDGKNSFFPGFQPRNEEKKLSETFFIPFSQL
tara:strand:- start:290 stop:487 length:198 start_codon:yes stop_codon:yes gene_type:complete